MNKEKEFRIALESGRELHRQERHERKLVGKTEIPKETFRKIGVSEEEGEEDPQRTFRGRSAKHNSIAEEGSHRKKGQNGIIFSRTTGKDSREESRRRPRITIFSGEEVTLSRKHRGEIGGKQGQRQVGQGFRLSVNR